MNQDISLDDLYREAKAAMRGQQAKLAKTPQPAKDPLLEGVYANPDNWTRGKTVVLLHEETQTFLGYFVEWTHRSVKDARRLVREATMVTPPDACAIEYISGKWAGTDTSVPAPKLPWKIDLPCVASIKLLDLGLSAEDVPMDFCFGEGRLDRIELAVSTTFHSPGQFLTLPAGTDILPRMLPVQVQDLLIQLGQA